MTLNPIPSNGPHYIAKASDMVWNGSGSYIPGMNVGSIVYITDQQKEYIADQDTYLVYYLTRTTGS